MNRSQWKGLLAYGFQFRALNAFEVETACECVVHYFKGVGEWDCLEVVTVTEGFLAYSLDILWNNAFDLGEELKLVVVNFDSYWEFDFPDLIGEYIL